MTLATRRMGIVSSCPGTGIAGWLYSSSISSPAAHDTDLLHRPMETFHAFRKLTFIAHKIQERMLTCLVLWGTALHSVVQQAAFLRGPVLS